MSRETSLVTAEWVASNLNNPSVVIVEVDEDTTLYAQGHIENAITFHWREDLQDGLIRDLISKEKFEALLSKSGISNDTTVVLYGGNNNWFATYAFWYFKIYGHADVRLLDGGRKRWELDARPFVTTVPTRTATIYKAKERDNSIRAYRDEVIAAELFGPEVSLDSRERMGDLIAIAKGEMILVDPSRIKEESKMVGHHGGLEAIEVAIPLLTHQS